MKRTNLSIDAKALLAQNPTVIGGCEGLIFYECPENGDEGSLLYIDHDGELKDSLCYDMPSVREWMD